MSQFSGQTRRVVIARAGGRCEYCQLPSLGQVATFPIDHVVPLFNPRIDTWEDHFMWSIDDALLLIGRTPTGRATIRRLQMNAPTLIVIRRMLSDLNMWLPTEDDRQRKNHGLP